MSLCRTLCGCLSFNEAQMASFRKQIDMKVKIHYQQSLGCKAKAKESWIWQQREPIGSKGDIGDEHDPAYDEPVQGRQPLPL